MADARITAGVTGWFVRRAVKGRQGGRLLYVTEDGEVVDLGSHTPAELLSLSWAWQVAYRLTRSREEKSRLARCRDSAARLGAGARALSSLSSSSKVNRT